MLYTRSALSFYFLLVFSLSFLLQKPLFGDAAPLNKGIDYSWYRNFMPVKKGDSRLGQLIGKLNRRYTDDIQQDEEENKPMKMADVYPNPINQRIPQEQQTLTTTCAPIKNDQNDKADHVSKIIKWLRWHAVELMKDLDELDDQLDYTDSNDGNSTEYISSVSVTTSKPQTNTQSTLSPYKLPAIENSHSNGNGTNNNKVNATNNTCEKNKPLIPDNMANKIVSPLPHALSESTAPLDIDIMTEAQNAAKSWNEQIEEIKRILKQGYRQEL